MRQPDKYRYLQAIKHIETGEISFQEDEFEPVIAEKIIGHSLPPVRSYELSAADLVELNIKAGNDLIFLANLWECGRKNIIADTGQKLYVDGMIKTDADLKCIISPNLSDARRRIEEVCEAVDGTGLGIKYRSNNSLFLAETGIGYQDYYVNLKINPEFIREFLKRVQDYCYAELEMALTLPIDIFQLSVLFGSTMGPLVSPEITEEFEYPQLRECIRMIKSKGKPVSLHIDGIILPYINDFIKMGFDIIHPIDPCGGLQDIYEVKKLYGDQIAIHGNIDVGGVLVFGTPDDIVMDVRRHLDNLSVGGGYVCSSSHNLTDAVGLEQFYAMRDTVQAYNYRPAAI